MPAASGQTAILRFPNTDLKLGKPRPVLLIAKTPGAYDDWLLAMISTQLSQAIPGHDEIVQPSANDFERSGLRAASVIRLSRLAVVNESVLLGKLGEVSIERLNRVRNKLAAWLSTETN